MAVTFPFGVWTILVLYLSKLRLRFDSRVLLLNVRLVTLLIIAFIPGVLAMIGEVLYTFSTSGTGGLHDGLAIGAGIRVGIVVCLCCFHSIRRLRGNREVALLRG